MPIHVLPDDVISQIAAGEVVERPASVVKELIENALDAGATTVHVEAVSGGRKRIRISDDGEGIRTDEVELAVMRHATSKLRSAQDLEAIHTLGFRGEALASIASVSHLTLVSRHRDDDLGTEIRVQGGKLTAQKSIGAPAGTVMTVENLFYNTPARLKFLKSENTEKRHINNIVQQYALAYPDVRFVLVQDGRESFRSPGSGQLSDVVVKVLGLDYFKQMLEISGESQVRETGGTIGVHGFVSEPGLHRKDRTRISLFVNGRYVQDSSLTYAVTQAYHGLIEKGRNPYAVLMLDVPPYFVDVNVHPTKAEVRFRDTNVMFTAVQRAVRRGVMGFLQSESHGGFRRPSNQQAPRDGWQMPYDRNRQMDMELDFDDAGGADSGADTYDPDDPTAIPEGMGRPRKPRTLPLLRVVGQVGAAYIVAEGPAGMYLIDQHAAHTRIIYEELLELYRASDDSVIPRRELQAQTIDMADKEARLLNDHLELLAQLGVHLEAFGSTTFKVRAIPAVVTAGDPVAFVWALLDVLGDKAAPEPLPERLVACIARYGAVKSGQLLETDDMRDLIQKLERCPNPQTSPGGKATLIHMSADQLERQFSRG
jgi:DNA mismatch repair protein MutL